MAVFNSLAALLTEINSVIGSRTTANKVQHTEHDALLDRIAETLFSFGIQWKPVDTTAGDATETVTLGDNEWGLFFNDGPNRMTVVPGNGATGLRFRGVTGADAFMDHEGEYFLIRRSGTTLYIVDYGPIVENNTGGPAASDENKVAATAAETLSSGQFVYVVGGSASLANAATGVPANGYVLQGCSAGDSCDVYLDGINNQLAGLTPGPLWLSSTPGMATSVVPVVSGQIRQFLGDGLTTTSMNFEPNIETVLA